MKVHLFNWTFPNWIMDMSTNVSESKNLKPNNSVKSKGDINIVKTAREII